MWSAAPILAAASGGLTSAQMNEAVVIAVAFGLLGYSFAWYSRRVIGIAPWNWPPLLWGLLGLIVPVFGFLLELIARMTTRAIPPTDAPGGPPPSSYFSGSGNLPPDPGAHPGPTAGGWATPPGPPSGNWPPPQPGQPIGSWPPPQPGQPPQPQQAPPSEGWQPQPGGAAGSLGPPPWTPPAGPAQAPTWAPPQPAGSWQPAPSGSPAPGPWGPPGDPANQPPGAPPAAPVWPPPLGPEAFENPAAYPGPNGWQPEGLLGSSTGKPPLFGWYADPAGIHEQRYWDGRQWSHRVSDNSVRGDDPLPPFDSSRAPLAQPTDVPASSSPAEDDTPPSSET